MAGRQRRSNAGVNNDPRKSEYLWSAQDVEIAPDKSGAASGAQSVQEQE